MLTHSTSTSVKSPTSLVDANELEAVEEHESVAEEELARSKRQSIPLSKCFEKYTECEQLGQSELWFCAKCKTHRQVRRERRIRSLGLNAGFRLVSWRDASL